MTESADNAFRDLGYQDGGRKYGPCSYCNGKGELLAFHKDEQIPYAFKCTCAAGERSERNFPLWPGFGAGYVIKP